MAFTHTISCNLFLNLVFFQFLIHGNKHWICTLAYNEPPPSCSHRSLTTYGSIYCPTRLCHEVMSMSSRACILYMFWYPCWIRISYVCFEICIESLVLSVFVFPCLCNRGVIPWFIRGTTAIILLAINPKKAHGVASFSLYL